MHACISYITRAYRSINRNRLAVFLLFTLAGFLYVACLDKHHGMFDENSYIFQALYVANYFNEGGIEMSLVPIENFHSGSKVYPWGTPFIYGITLAIFGYNIIALKITNIIAVFIFTYIIYRVSRPFLHKKSIVLTALILLNPLTFTTTNNVMSESHYALVALLCIVALQKIYLINKERPINQVWYFLAVTALCATPLLFRLAGMMIAFAFLTQYGLDLMLSFTKRNNKLLTSVIQKILVILGLTLLLFLVWKLWFEHTSFFRANRNWPIAVSNINTQLIQYIFNVSDFTYTPLPLNLWTIGMFFFLCILGFLQRWKTDSLVIYYTIYSILLYAFNDMRVDIRYLAPILPIMLLYSFYGLAYIGKKYRTISKAILVYSFLLLGVWLYQFTDIWINKKYLDTKPGFATNIHAIEVYTFLKEKISPTTLIYTEAFNGRSLMLYVGKTTIDGLNENTWKAFNKKTYMKKPSIFVFHNNEDSLQHSINLSGATSVLKNDLYEIYKKRPSSIE